jgi:hypothetical protein
MFLRYKWVALVYVLGVIYLCVLLSFSKEQFFYSEDGGLKFLMLSEYLNGDWNSTLDIQHNAWEETLWQEGMYPFRAPFVYQTEYGRVCAFPPFFSMLSTPFYAMFGYRGLYIIPCLSVLFLWGLFISLGIKMNVRPFTLLLGFTAIVFASSLTLYGAIFWEHTLAALCVFASLYFCILQRKSPEGLQHSIKSLLYMAVLQDWQFGLGPKLYSLFYF